MIILYTLLSTPEEASAAHWMEKKHSVSMVGPGMDGSAGSAD